MANNETIRLRNFDNNTFAVPLPSKYPSTDSNSCCWCCCWSSILFICKWWNEWMNEWINEWMNEWINKWINEWVNEWMNEPMNEWTNEWMHVSVNDSTRHSVSLLIFTFTHSAVKSITSYRSINESTTLEPRIDARGSKKWGGRISSES